MNLLTILTNPWNGLTWVKTTANFSLEGRTVVVAAADDFQELAINQLEGRILEVLRRHALQQFAAQRCVDPCAQQAFL